MIVCFHLTVFLVNEYFTPAWQKNVRDVSREVVEAMTTVKKDIGSSQNY